MNFATKICIVLIGIFLSNSVSSYGQMQATFSTNDNSICDGSGCDYDGPSILINEIMISPTVYDGSLWEPNCMGATPRCGEWIELYNPNICEPVDISCYYLGNNAFDLTNDYPGGYIFPQGTVVPPAGFLVLRGTNAPSVNPNLLIENGGKTIEIVMDGHNTCIGNGSRLWFPNAGGWFAFYDENGVPQDAISWGSSPNLGYEPCKPTTAGCSFSGSLPSYNAIPSDRKNKVFNGFSNGWGQTVSRSPDGWGWDAYQGSFPTQGSCNDVCADVGESTCDGSATITVTGGTPPYSYTWNDSQGQTTQTATELCSGTYQVTVKDANGNVQVFTVIIEDLTLDITTTFQEDYCANGSGEITVTDVVGGDALPYVYSNNGGANYQDDPHFGGLYADTYTVMAMDTNSCVGSEEVTLEAFEAVPHIEVGIDPTCHDFCDGSVEVTLDGGTAPIVYNWEDENGNTIGNTAFVEDLCAGTYSVTIEDGVGCELTGSVTLVNPALLTYQMEGTNLTCGNVDGSITFSDLSPNTDYEISYEHNGTAVSAFIFTTDNDGKYVLDNLPKGVYTNFDLVEVDGCPLSNDATLTLIEPGPPIIVAPADQEFCYGEEITLSAYNPDNAIVTWDNGVVNGVPFDATTLGSTTYTVVAKIDNCTSTDQVTITVLPIPEVTFDGVDLYGCKPHTSSFIGQTDGISCVWDFGDNTIANDCGPQVHTYQYSGLFTVTLTVEGENGCKTTFERPDYVEITPKPIADFITDPEKGNILNTEIQFINKSEYATDYIWIFGDESPISNEVNPLHLYPEDIVSNYYVTLIATKGEECVDTVVRLVVIEDALIFYIPNTFTPDGNEFNETFQPVFTSGFDPYNFYLAIYNRWGELMFESRDAAAGWNGRYGGKIAPDGTYVWKIEFLETMSDKRHTYTGHVNLIR